MVSWVVAVAAVAAVPGGDATWAPLQSQPVRVECTSVGEAPYCRSTGVIGVPADVAAETFRTLDRYVDRMGAIAKVVRLEPDVLHVVMDYPFPLTDRDYVARFTYREDPDGTRVFAWKPVEHPQAPDTGDTVRLAWLDGEWRFAPDGANTRVTYVWQADPGGRLPDVGAVRKQAGTLAIEDIANACGTKVLSP